jgi:hypothetical protein
MAQLIHKLRKALSATVAALRIVKAECEISAEVRDCIDSAEETARQPLDQYAREFPPAQDN